MLVGTAALLMTTPIRAQTADAVHVATYLEVRSASTSEAVALTAEYERATRADAGNIEVTALQEIGRPDRFVMMETWNDQASFADHEKAPHTLAFRQKLSALYRSPYDQRVNRGFAVDPSPRTAGPKAIFVVTHVDVPGARRQDAEAILRPLSEATRTDPGRVRYDVYQQMEPRMNHFTLLAVWDSQSALDAYGNTAHRLRFREALAPMLGALYDERLYRPVQQ
jgi:quinol monooxygenase YgiN